MRRHYQSLLILSLCLTVLTGCGPAARGNGAGEVADEFYEIQRNSALSLPPELFTDTRVGMEAENQIGRRNMAYGAYISHSRVGTNRRMSLEGRVRKESVTFIFEVNCDNGMTRETLMISRAGTSEPYLITAYVIEAIPRIDNPIQDGTSST